MRGRLIALEGIDGCGKSTQAKLLFESIGEADALLTSEPGATSLGARLRRLLLDPEMPEVCEHAEALLLAADRAEHVFEVISPALARGLWVVSDRYSGSTYAYQGYGRGLDIDGLRRIITFATGGLEADVNVLVDVPVATARARLEKSAADRLERLDESFHERVRNGYLAMAAQDPRWAVVDGTRAVQEVSEQISSAVTARLGPLRAGAR